MFEDLLLSTLRLSIPLIFAAYGGLLSERSGIANIALESYLLFSAFVAASVTAITSNLILGVAAGVLASGVVGALFAAISIYGRGDQIVIGTAFNLMAAGLIPVFCRSLFDVTGATPSLPLNLRFQNPWGFVFLAFGIAGALHWMIYKSRFGLRIWAAGENPLSIHTQGVSVNWVRMKAVTLGAMIAGLGGVFMSLALASGFVRNMSAGRGFIALAALIFGGWRPVPALLACLLFGFTDALQIYLQGQDSGIAIPNQFVQIIPYLVTLGILVFYSGKMKAPKALNQDLSELAEN